MNSFKVGQKVVVKNAHACGADDFGVITALGKEKEYIGLYWVDIGGTKLPVEPSRLEDEKSYWEKLHASRR